jgi:hypothetical protein
MSGLEGGFDPVGVVIDWLDACRQRRLTDLLELYADQATLDCCGGGRSSSDELACFAIGRASSARRLRPSSSSTKFSPRETASASTVAITTAARFERNSGSTIRERSPERFAYLSEKTARKPRSLSLAPVARR